MKHQKTLFTLAFIILAASGLYYAHAAGKLRLPEKAPVSVAVAFACEGKEISNFDCYEKYYGDIVAGQGVKAAFDDLKTRYETSAYIKAQCHPIAHVIGRAAINKYPTVSAAYAQGDPFCWSGYYHGALEGVIAKMGRKNVPNQLNTICQDIEGKERYSFDYFNCVHGLGHGLMAFTNTELPDSLKLCDNLEGSWEKRSCYGGVFMENVIVDNKNHVTKYLRPEEPLYPCNAIDDAYKNDCYLMQTSYMLKVTNNDFQKVFDLCSTVGEIYTATCYQSLGRDASGQNSSNAEITKARCMLGRDKDQRLNCVVGAVKDFISYFHAIEQANVFCNSLDGELKETCLSVGAAYYKAL